MSTSAAPRVKPIYGWRAAITDSELAPPARLVLLCLSLYMNEKTTSCFPSYDRLTHDTGLSRRTVIDHVQAAVDAGWLKVTRGGGRRSNIYSAAIPRLGDNVDRGVQELHYPVREVHPSGAGDRDRGVQELHPNNPVNDPLNSGGAHFSPGAGFIKPHVASHEDRSAPPIADLREQLRSKSRTA